MTAVSLALVLSSALAHATWNLFAKRAGDGGLPFVWLFALASAVLYLPVVVGFLAVARPALAPSMALFVLGSGALHLGYFTLLQRGYNQGDLSLVYPLARGTGPLLSSVAAAVWLDERPGLFGWVGVGLTTGGVLVLAAARPSGAADAWVATAYGLGTGVFVALYTLWDRQAVVAAAVPPLLLTWSSDVVRVALLGPRVAREPAAVRRIWRSYRREVLGVAVLSPLAYILVLSALAVAPVSAVAPVREVSVVLGVLYGSRLLAEQRLLPKLASAAAIASGVALIAVT